MINSAVITILKSRYVFNMCLFIRGQSKSLFTHRWLEMVMIDTCSMVSVFQISSTLPSIAIKETSIRPSTQPKIMPRKATSAAQWSLHYLPRCGTLGPNDHTTTARWGPGPRVTSSLLPKRGSNIYARLIGFVLLRIKRTEQNYSYFRQTWTWNWKALPQIW